jgi:hypothetical protein
MGKRSRDSSASRRQRSVTELTSWDEEVTSEEAPQLDPPGSIPTFAARRSIVTSPRFRAALNQTLRPNVLVVLHIVGLT